MIRRLAQRLDNFWHESTYGISTRGVVDIDNPDSVYYAATPYSSIRKVLDLLALRPPETFVDIGCGKGRVVCVAARHQLAQVIGIDISEELCIQARINAERLRGRKSPITIYNGQAQELDYSKVDIVFLFNPFGADTLDQVLTKIRHDKGNQPVRFAYAVPTHKRVFDDHRWLEEYQPSAATDDTFNKGVALFRTT